MSDLPERVNRSHLRASDAERDALVAELREHSALGRLTLEEFGERLEAALVAKTRGELEALKADLPELTLDAAPAHLVAAPRRRRRRRRWVMAILGGAGLSGRWRPESSTNVIAIMGGVDMDLRQVTPSADEIVLNCFTFMGGVEIRAPHGMAVEMRGLSLLGGRDVVPTPHETPGMPRLVVRGFTMMGGVSVTR